MSCSLGWYREAMGFEVAFDDGRAAGVQTERADRLAEFPRATTSQTPTKRRPLPERGTSGKR